MSTMPTKRWAHKIYSSSPAKPNVLTPIMPLNASMNCTETPQPIQPIYGLADQYKKRHVHIICWLSTAPFFDRKRHKCTCRMFAKPSLSDPHRANILCIHGACNYCLAVFNVFHWRGPFDNKVLRTKCACVRCIFESTASRLVSDTNTCIHILCVRKSCCENQQQVLRLAHAIKQW